MISSIKKKLTPLYDRINQEIASNRPLISFSSEIVKGIANFAILGKPSSLFEGLFEGVQELSSFSNYPDIFFSVKNSWKELSCAEASVASLFAPILNNYPAKTLRFGQYNTALARLITLPIGTTIGLVEETHSKYSDGGTQIFFKPAEISQEKLQRFLSDELIKTLSGNCFSLMEKNSEKMLSDFVLVSEDLTSIVSKRTKEYVLYLQNCLSKNINRSILFYGTPGSGKSTLAKSILKELNLRTLKFRYNKNYSFSIFKFLVRYFDIKAVLIDDFDICDHSTNLLEFLEFLNKEVKVVLLCANTFAKFHPAIVRAGRIDEIKKIDTLEKETIKELLGASLYRIYGSKMDKMPVAFLQEFLRRKEIGKEKLPVVFKELDKRAKDQIKKLKQVEKQD